MRTIRARHVLDLDGVRDGVAITIEGGRIVAVGPAGPGPVEDVLVLPAPANAHDHARPVRTSSIGGAGRPLETWLPRLALFPAVDPGLVARAALGRAAVGGAGAVMVHHTRPHGGMPLPEEAVRMAAAAREVGVRIALAVAMRDRNPLVYGPSDPVLDALSPAARAAVAETFLARAPLPPAGQVALVEAVAAAAGGPFVDVQFGPNGVQWCTTPLLEAIAEASARTGRRVHMHLLETRYQRDWADREVPGGIVRFLDGVGLLSPRLTLAHCTWARPDELELIAARGATIAVNASSNLALRSGIAPVGAMMAAGCRIAMGIDGQAFDEDDDLLREMRLLHGLHAGRGFETGFEAADALRAVLATGRGSLGAPGDGRIAPGAPADLLLIDRSALDEDALMPVPPTELLFSRATRRHLRELMVDGRTVVRDGRLSAFDLDRVQDELRAAIRAGIAADRGPMLAALPELEGAVARHFADRAGCC
jgi:cytosine/adenosine deaminase-related metal-dependent hydrolase